MKIPNTGPPIFPSTPYTLSIRRRMLVLIRKSSSSRCVWHLRPWWNLVGKVAGTWTAACCVNLVCEPVLFDKVSAEGWDWCFLWCRWKKTLARIRLNSCGDIITTMHSFSFYQINNKLAGSLKSYLSYQGIFQTGFFLIAYIIEILILTVVGGSVFPQTVNWSWIMNMIAL